MAVVDFYWDIGSTNTYFAFRLLPGVLARTGAELRCHPYNLGYVFRHNEYVLAEEPREKRLYRLRDLERWAEHLQLPFKMPSRFPIKTSRALRGALVMKYRHKEMEYMNALFTAYWEKDLAVETYQDLAPIAETLGVSGDEFQAEAESEEIRQEIIDITQQGISKGFFGAPMFVVNGEMFWGKDRMDYLERAIRELE
jgi:2-hydroxychromene-2-carboxylate isomerase